MIKKTNKHINNFILIIKLNNLTIRKGCLLNKKIKKSLQQKI